MEKGFKRIIEVHRKQAFKLMFFSAVIIAISSLLTYYILASQALQTHEIVSLMLFPAMLLCIGLYLALKSRQLLTTELEEMLTASPVNISTVRMRSLSAALTYAEAGIKRLSGIALHIGTKGKAWNMIIDDSDFVDIYYFLCKTATGAKIETDLLPAAILDEGLGKEIAA
jgi:hypothetical protein